MDKIKNYTGGVCVCGGNVKKMAKVEARKKLAQKRFSVFNADELFCCSNCGQIYAIANFIVENNDIEIQTKIINEGGYSSTDGKKRQ